jgi:hypothetical protein
VTFTPQADGAASKPQQAMLLLQPKAHKGLSAYAVAKARKDGAHVVSLSQALVEKQLGSLVCFRPLGELVWGRLLVAGLGAGGRARGRACGL